MRLLSRSRVLKRLIDLCVAAIALLILFPLLLLVAVAVRVFVGAPILFREERAGGCRRPFALYKFPNGDRKTGDGRIAVDVRNRSAAYMATASSASGL